MTDTEDRRTNQIGRASTPDPDGPPCEFCGGGLGHYPECPEWPSAYVAPWRRRSIEQAGGDRFAAVHDVTGAA
jgi:hypothetical protein